MRQCTGRNKCLEYTVLVFENITRRKKNVFEGKEHIHFLTMCDQSTMIVFNFIFEPCN